MDNKTSSLSQEVLPRLLSEAEADTLAKQDGRGLVSDFQQKKLEKEASKNWDKFYMRNGDRFFKDRHWTTREFIELLDSSSEIPTLFEVGCGVGNFFYPLLEEGLKFKVHACDFSSRAIDMVKKNPAYNENINAFVCDITKDDLAIDSESVDIVSLIFVLSSILPCYMGAVLKKLFDVLRPGGLLLFRDYGLYDMAMIRFKPGSKLGDRLYVRQDGTRAYYFSARELEDLLKGCGFELVMCDYVSRKTVNLKEGINAQRIFVQAKCRKPVNDTEGS